MTALVVLYWVAAGGLVLGGSELSPSAFWGALALLALFACYVLRRFVHALFAGERE